MCLTRVRARLTRHVRRHWAAPDPHPHDLTRLDRLDRQRRPEPTHQEG